MNAPTNIQRTSSSRRRTSSLLTLILHPVGALVLALALGVGMLAIVDVHPTRAQTAIPSGTEVIAYVNGAWSEYHQVYLYDPVTGQDEAITDLPDWMTHPMNFVSISPDGTKVAFQAYSDTGTAYTLWVVPSQGGQEIQMLPSSWSIGSADWSPDSKTLVFWGRDGSSTDYDRHIYTVEVTETGKVTPTLVDIRPEVGTEIYLVPNGGTIFNKDGTAIIFVGDPTTGPSQIYSVPIAGGAPTPLTHLTYPDAGQNPGPPAISPDGQTIAYAGSDSSQVRQIYTIPANGSSDPTQITHEESADVTDLEISSGHSVAFSPDGSKILFSRYQVSTQDTVGFYTVPVNGGSTSVLMTRSNLHGAADWGIVRDVDQTAPTVTSTVPTANAKGVAPTINVKATFSEDPLVSSINGKTFKLFKSGSTTKIAATVTYNADTRTAKLDPNNNLRRGVTYKAVVTTVAKDVAGNQLDQYPDVEGLQQKAWLFKIRS